MDGMSTNRARKTSKGKATRGSSVTTADLVVLSLLTERPMHGYELVKEYERQEVADWASVSRPHVYYALQKLADCGYVDAVASSRTPDPRGKAVYRITRDGGQALSVALSSIEWAQNRTPTAFNTWLGLSIHAREADRRRLLAERRAYLKDQIAKEKRTAAEITVAGGSRARIAAVMVGLCIEQFETELRWLDTLEDALLNRS
jgi:DNA-binding PadR family transcriptional regulator